MDKVKLIAIEEWKNINRQGILRVMVLVIISVLLLSAYTGWEAIYHHNKEQDHYQSEVAKLWEGQPNRHPHRVSHYGYLVFRDKYPLSAFDFGINSYVGNSIFLEAHRQNTMNMSDASFSNGMLRFGELSMGMIFQVILPLFIIFIGFGSISGFKHNGVLKLILMQNTRYIEVILGKTLGIFGVVLNYFFPILLGGLLFSYFTANGDVEGILGRIFLLILAYTLYFFIFCMLVVLVSAICKTPKNTLLVLLISWFFLVLIIPKMGQTLGARVYESPNKNDFDIAIQEKIKKEGDSHNPDDSHFKELKNNILRKHKVDSIEDLPINYGGVIFEEGEKITTEIFREKFEELINIYRKQNRINEILGFLNPYLAIRNISMGFSGSSFSDAINFQRQAEDYRYERTQHLNKLQQKEIKYYKETQLERTQKIDNKLLKEMPKFKYEQFSLTEILKEQVLNILALIFFFLILLGGSYFIQKNTNKYL